jgi:hypothetical protein
VYGSGNLSLGLPFATRDLVRWRFEREAVNHAHKDKSAYPSIYNATLPFDMLNLQPTPNKDTLLYYVKMKFFATLCLIFAFICQVSAVCKDCGTKHPACVDDNNDCDNSQRVVTGGGPFIWGICCNDPAFPHVSCNKRW